MLGIVALYTTWAVLSGYVNCVPVAKFWDREIPGGCLDFEIVWFFNASMNIATDVALFILPMPLLSRLQLPRMQKIGLMGVFAIGILYAVPLCPSSQYRPYADSTPAWSSLVFSVSKVSERSPALPTHPVSATLYTQSTLQP